MHTKTCDVVVIGAGSGGLTAAVGFAKLGKRVVLVEREHLGGECTNSGCIPSKALLHYAKAYAEAVRISGTTEQNETFRRDAFTYVRSKINEVLADETPAHFEKLGITVVMGEAAFASNDSVVVNDTTYRFARAVIATGSSPRTLAIPGLDPEKILTNQNLFQLATIPSSVLIIGGGPIGMEMGQALSLLGSKVTIIENGARFARLEDEAIGSIITKTFTDLGITIYTSASVERVEHTSAVVAITDGDATRHETIPFDSILLAIGRVPNFPKDLEKAGIKKTEYGITVNTNWQTTNRSVYALGDVAAPLKFTHVADDTARQVVTHVVSRGLLNSKTKAVPKVTYTEPEIAQVGLSHTEATKRFGTASIMRIEVPLSAVDRARTDEASSGILVVIAKRLSGKILGAHLIGPRAGELISIFTLAIDRGISLYTLRATIFAYPTYALVIKKAGDYFLAQQIKNLRTDLIMLTKRLAPKIILLTIWIIGLIALYQYQQMFDLTATEMAFGLFEFITTTLWGPLLYILAYTIRPLLFFPGTLLTILSGVFFGFWGGFVYTMIAANLSASLAYGVGRYFAGAGSLEHTALARFIAPLQKNPFTTTLTMRLIFIPFDVVNYGAGLLKLPFVPYLIATILGTILGIATFVSIGSSLNIAELKNEGFSYSIIEPSYLLLSLAIFVVSLGVGRLLKKSPLV